MQFFFFSLYKIEINLFNNEIVNTFLSHMKIEQIIMNAKHVRHKINVTIIISMHN
jgi:hypothetical protein